MTLKDFLVGPVLTQYKVLEWADREFPASTGRFFGGALTPDQVERLKKLTQ